jgi:hypothetical protein
MSHSKFLLQRLGKTGVQRAEPSAGVWGVPEKPFFLFLLAAAGGKRGKRSLGTPQTPAGRPLHPGQGLAALDNPAWQGEL